MENRKMPKAHDMTPKTWRIRCQRFGFANRFEFSLNRSKFQVAKETPEV